jgi:hypothetical protein
MPPLSGYDPKESLSQSAAGSALFCGVVSGPVSVFAGSLAITASGWFFGPPLPDFMCVGAMAIVLLAALVFSCVVRLNLPAGSPPRHRWLATLAVLFPIVYGVVLFALMCASVQE